MVIKVGTCSWTDPTLLKAGWYPQNADSAEGRLAHASPLAPARSSSQPPNVAS